MKRSPMSPRKAPLRSYTPLKPGGELSRSTPLRSTPPPPSAPRVRTEAERGASRRPLVTPEERRARDLVRARSGDVCEGCRRRPATDWSHRIGRGVGGPWHVSNGLHLCRPCHDWIGDQPAAARAVGWRLTSTDDYLTTPVQLPAHGYVLLGADGSITPTERSGA